MVEMVLLHLVADQNCISRGCVLRWMVLCDSWTTVLTCVRNSLVHQFEELDKLRHGYNAEVPFEIFEYVLPYFLSLLSHYSLPSSHYLAKLFYSFIDQGRNPDLYIKESLDACLNANGRTKGKLDAIQVCSHPPWVLQTYTGVRRLHKRLYSATCAKYILTYLFRLIKMNLNHKWRNFILKNMKNIKSLCTTTIIH